MHAENYNMKKITDTNKSKKIYVVGIGPGKKESMTIEAIRAIELSNSIVGYSKYIEIVKSNFPEISAECFFQTGMMKEKERCLRALEIANEGETVALVCSGDSVVYGMASLILELSSNFPEVEIEIVAGITAALSGSALLGSPLTSDFAVISLSNLLTPKEKIDKRIKAASLGDFVTVLYNPKSKGRSEALNDAVKIFLEDRSAETICAVTRNICRNNESVTFCTLAELPSASVDMFCTVFIGNSETKLIIHNGRKLMLNPRGYNLSSEKNA